MAYARPPASQPRWAFVGRAWCRHFLDLRAIERLSAQFCLDTAGVYAACDSALFGLFARKPSGNALGGPPKNHTFWKADRSIESAAGEAALWGWNTC